MGIKERFKNIFNRGKKASTASGSKSSDTSAARSGAPVPWLYSTSPALCISTAYRCIDLLSKSVANLPVVCKRKKGKIFVEDTRGTLPYLLNIEPDTATNAFDFWRQVIIEVLCTGNAYIVPYYSYATGDWYRLALCGRGTVVHNWDNDTYTVNDFTNGIYGVYSENEIIHIKGMTGPNYKTGLSVLSYARNTLNTATAGDQEALKRFANSGAVKGMISAKNGGEGVGFLQDNEKSAFDLAKTIDRQQSEMDIIALPGEYSFQQFSLSSADMQFLESRRFTVREICRFFGVHPSFVFDDTSNNYKSAEMANVAFLSNTLNPMLRQIENEMLRKLFSPNLCLSRKIEFDRQGLYACDLESRVKYISALIGAGLNSINEARIKEGMEPVEGGDRIFVSANLKGIEEFAVNDAQQQNQGNDGKEE